MAEVGATVVALDFGADHAERPIRLLDGDSFDMEEESWNKITCDATNTYWAMCDLWDVSTIPDFLVDRFPQGNRASSYFSDDNLLVSFAQADYCPVAIDFLFFHTFPRLFKHMFKDLNKRLNNTNYFLKSRQNHSKFFQ